MYRLLCFIRDKILPQPLCGWLDDYIFTKYDEGVELELCNDEDHNGNETD